MAEKMCHCPNQMQEADYYSGPEGGAMNGLVKGEELQLFTSGTREMEEYWYGLRFLKVS